MMLRKNIINMFLLMSIGAVSPLKSSHQKITYEDGIPHFPNVCGSCYINSCVQALYGLAPLNNFLTNSETRINEKDDLLLAYQQVVKDLNNKVSTYVSMSTLMGIITEKYTTKIDIATKEIALREVNKINQQNKLNLSAKRLDEIAQKVFDLVSQYKNKPDKKEEAVQLIQRSLAGDDEFDFIFLTTEALDIGAGDPADFIRNLFEQLAKYNKDLFIIKSRTLIYNQVNNSVLSDKPYEQPTDEYYVTVSPSENNQKLEYLLKKPDKLNDYVKNKVSYKAERRTTYFNSPSLLNFNLKPESLNNWKKTITPLRLAWDTEVKNSNESKNYTLQSAIIYPDGADHFEALVLRNNHWWRCNDTAVVAKNIPDSLSLLKRSYFIFYTLNDAPNTTQDANKNGSSSGTQGSTVVRNYYGRTPHEEEAFQAAIIKKNQDEWDRIEAEEKLQKEKEAQKQAVPAQKKAQEEKIKKDAEQKSKEEEEDLRFVKEFEEQERLKKQQEDAVHRAQNKNASLNLIDSLNSLTDALNTLRSSMH